MNHIIEEMDSLMHYGMPRRSGRYPWGSGDDSYQRGNRDLLGRIEDLKKSGWTETPENIKKEFNMSTTEYRAQKAIAKQERRNLDVARAKSLKEDGLGATEIGKKMGLPESTVRSLLNDRSEVRMKKAQETADFLKKMVDEKGIIDIGTGVERNPKLNISREKLNQALKILEKDGYYTFGARVPQVLNPGQSTTIKVLAPPGTPYKINEKGQRVSKVAYDFENIKSIDDYISRDNGATFEKKFHYPASLDSKRVKILLADDINPTDGEPGVAKDGLIQIRRGVDDLSLGNSRYAQVRILVDDTKYLKGMAVYADNMPDGIDVIFNSNKHSVEKAYKKIEDDPENPFGSLIKDADQGGQYWYTDKKTGERKLGLINKRADEGDWSEWKDTLPSQFLSKQSLTLAKKQLDEAKKDRMAEFKDICEINNPTVKKQLLETFASQCDSDSIHLKAASLPGQKYHVMIPISGLKDGEAYCPNYENGTKLALVRYPHGGIFEIPIVTVNNKHQQSINVLGKDIGDAIAVNKRTADVLSGADYDGDTVMCIPTDNGKIKISRKPPLKDLEDFDPTEEYGPDTYEPGTVKLMNEKSKGLQMGSITNLITDMTLAGASDEELARAVKHSMVVIDAVKHKLNYKKSEVDNNIKALIKNYQRTIDEDGNVKTGGASTIISAAKSPVSVYKRQGTPYVNIKGKEGYDPNRPEGALIYKQADDLYKPVSKMDKKTGIRTLTTIDGKKVKYNPKNKEDSDMYSPIKRVNKETGEVTYTNKDGSITYKLEPKRQESRKMAETDDARTLVSAARHPMELLYADYANSMKALANQARIEKINTGKIEYDANAKAVYQAEVDSLMSKLNTALLNAPLERMAQLQTAASVQAKKKAAKEAGSELSKDEIKKAGTQALRKARLEVGSVSRRDRNINITDREWEAIQAGAISENRLKKILANTDIDALRQKATPRTTNSLSSAKIARLKSYQANGYTLAEMARKLGVSTSTVSKYLKGE